ncbi:MAG: A/G-specific adenine glycosylase [Rhabdochlamydiaceae bacterium]|nr:A/G-specific adenine glycosylase [Candidatus Amphrikana amoebophyrae]
MNKIHAIYLSNDIIKWFVQHKRELPWRENCSPYQVWISEIMLQQTQVNTVIPYYLNWLNLFPSIEVLAQSSESEVIKAWEGLGYYSRARSIHKAAKLLVEKFNSQLPTNRKALEAIPGIGPYTAGAILSFAFKQKAHALDGNVIRIFSRLHKLDHDVSKPIVIKALRQSLFDSLGDDQPWVVMEGLIELGALICNKNPKCHICPIKVHCKARKTGDQLDYPKKKKPPQMTLLERALFCLTYKGQVLIKLGQEKLMQDLWHFPFCDLEDDADAFLNGLGFKNRIKINHFNPVSHSFTRFRCTLFPTVWKVGQKIEIKGFKWVDIMALHELPFQSGHRQIKEKLVDNSQTSYT